MIKTFFRMNKTDRIHHQKNCTKRNGGNSQKKDQDPPKARDAERMMNTEKGKSQ